MISDDAVRSRLTDEQETMIHNIETLVALNSHLWMLISSVMSLSTSDERVCALQQCLSVELCLVQPDIVERKTMLQDLVRRTELEWDSRTPDDEMRARRPLRSNRG